MSNSTQDSQSELDDIFNEHVENIQEGVVSAIQVGENVDYHTFDAKVELREAIEAYVTTRVKEAEAEEVEMAADFAEDVLQQFGYNGKSGGLSTLEWAEGIIKRHKKLQALTTTTNGEEE